MAIVHKLVPKPVKVDDPLLVENIAVGLALSPQLDGRVFVGLTFEGRQGIEDAHGDVVLTLELAAKLAQLLVSAVARAEAKAGTGTRKDA